MRRRVKLFSLAVTYIVVFAITYRYFLSSVYAYIGYDLNERGLLSDGSTMLISAVPILFVRDHIVKPGLVLGSLVYTLAYVPILYVTSEALYISDGELLRLHITLCACMTAILYFANFTIKGINLVRVPVLSENLIIPFVLILLAVFSVIYRGTMRLVTFSDVYELRFASGEVQTGSVIGYLVMWMTYCIVPYLVARGWALRRWGSLLIAFLACLIIYMITGAKSAILVPVFLFVVANLAKSNSNFVSRLLAWLSFGVFGILLIPQGFSSVTDMVKAIFLHRMLGSNGWVFAQYYDFFGAMPHTYYTHISIIRALFGFYPYGSLSLGQVIGLEVSGSSLANFNAGFWATDGIAAAGLTGVVLCSIIVLSFFILLNSISNRFESRFMAMWVTGFGLSLLNLPFATALVSGGGFLMLLMMIFLKFPKELLRASENAHRSY